MIGSSSCPQGFPPVISVWLQVILGVPDILRYFQRAANSKGFSYMKTLRFISTFAMLALATVVTAGSMYVTVVAAAQQESTDSAVVLPSAATVQDIPVVTDVADGPGLDAAIEGLEPALDKTQILRDQQSHVILDDKGGFKGRLSSLRKADGEPVPAANLNVTLAQHGAIIGSTTTDVNGRFSFTGLPDGVVAIWAEGKDALMLSSFVLFGKDTAIEENAGLVAAQVELDVDSAVVFGADIATVKELMSPYLNIQDKRFANELAAEDQEFNFGSGEVSATLRNHSVSLQADGSLNGELSILDDRTGRVREVLDMTVHFVRNGVKAASSEVSNDGSFIANGLTPGVYSVVTVGQDGILVCSVNVVGTALANNRVQDVGLGEFTPASTVSASLMLGGFGGSPVGAGNLGAFSGASGGGGLGLAGMNSAPPANGAGGQSGGGSGGGTGGGGAGAGGAGGGGLLGALLAGGIGGAIGYAAGDNNNGNPASPGN